MNLIFLFFAAIIQNVDSIAVSNGDIEITNGAYDKFIRGSAGYDVFELSTDITIEDGFTIEVPEGYSLTISPDTGDEISRPFSKLPLFTVYGTLILEGVIITSLSSDGGAVRVYDGGILIARSTEFLSCEAINGHGGAIYNSGNMNLSHTSFDSCLAVNGTMGQGGAIYNTQGATAVINDATINDCNARFGGAITNNGTGVMTVVRSAFTSNNGTVSGGDVYVTGMGSDVTIHDSTFSLSYGGSRGGSISLEDGDSTMVVKSSLFSLTSAGRKGGCLSAQTSASLTFKDVHFLDASLGSEAEGLGGCFYLSDTAVLTGHNITFASTTAGSLLLPTTSAVISGHCAEGRGKGCGRGVYRGGAVYAMGQTDVTLRDVNCIGLHAADNGACIYATGDVSLSVNTGNVNASVNTSRAVALVSMSETSSFSNLKFKDNTGSFFISSSSVEMKFCSFNNEVSLIGSGGSMILTDDSTLTASNITALNCISNEDGGWLWAESSSIQIEGFIGSGNYADDKGGVFFVDSMYEVLINNLEMINNTAKTGGVLFARACSYPDLFMDHYLYKGVQLSNGLVQSNNAREGGALYGEDSVLFSNNLKFIDNYGVGDNVRGSTSIFTPDAIYLRTTITSSFASTETRFENTSVLEGERVVFDSSSFTYPSIGVAIKLWNDTTHTGEGYTLLSRNSDLSQIRKNHREARWNYARCYSNNDDGVGDGVATNNYPMDYSVKIREMPFLEEMGLNYDPVCPSDALCVNDATLLSINCTCPESTSSFNDVNNQLSQCQTYIPTATPTLAPTVAIVNTPLPTSSPKLHFTNYTIATNPYVGVKSIYNLEVIMQIVGLVLMTIIGIAFITSCLVDLRTFEGMQKSEKQILLLSVMYYFPSTFHRILCMQRDPILEMLNSAEQKEDAKEKAKFLHRTMSMGSADADNFFRGGSFDDGFFKSRSQSFDPGFGFDLARANSFTAKDFKASSFAPSPNKQIELPTITGGTASL